MPCHKGWQLHLSTRGTLYLGSKGGQNAGHRGSLTVFTSRRATLVGFGVAACLVVEVKISVSPLRMTAWCADGSPRDVNMVLERYRS